MRASDRAMVWGSVLWLGINAWPPSPVVVSAWEAVLPAVAFTCARWSVKWFRIWQAQGRSS